MAHNYRLCAILPSRIVVADRHC